jgi:DNA-binding MarR family transcriptional regulator
MTFPIPVLQSLSERLSDNSWRMLQILKEYKSGIQVASLMNLMQLKQAKFYSELSRIDGAALINQNRDPKDSRSKVISLNENGQAMLDYERSIKNASSFN